MELPCVCVMDSVVGQQAFPVIDGTTLCVCDSVVDQQAFPVIDGTTLCVCDR